MFAIFGRSLHLQPGALLCAVQKSIPELFRTCATADAEALFDCIASIAIDRQRLSWACLKLCNTSLQVANDRLSQLFGWALTRLLFQPLVYGIFVASARPLVRCCH